MDNLTHSLVGLLVAKSGLDRLSPYAVPAAVIAANAPDLDLISVAGGRWSYLEYHRGISHSLPGTLALSLAIPIIIWGVDRLVAHWCVRLSRVKIKGLILVCLVAGATHPLLDWTNNYGVRPLLPWSPRWFYGDLVFIMDPWLWLLLGGAAFILTGERRSITWFWLLLAAVLTTALVLAMIYSVPSSGSTVGSATLLLWVSGLAVIAVLFRTRSAWRTRRIVALFALLCVPFYWGGLAILHARALRQGETTAGSAAREHGEHLSRVIAMPTFGNPLRWQVLAESDRAIYRFVHELGPGAAGESDMTRFDKPSEMAVLFVDQASRTPEGKVFLGFARIPLARVDGKCPNFTVVHFADLRYTEPGAGRVPFALDVPVDCTRITDLSE